ASPAERLGYAAAGPIFYAFGRFILDELAATPRAKPLFLMRDAYLPQKVTAAIAGGSVGAPVSVSRFGAFAASFRSADAVERHRRALRGRLRRHEALRRPGAAAAPPREHGEGARRRRRAQEPPRRGIHEAAAPSRRDGDDPRAFQGVPRAAGEVSRAQRRRTA